MSPPNPSHTDNTDSRDAEKDIDVSGEKINHEVFSAMSSGEDVLFSGMRLVDPALNAKMHIVNNVRRFHLLNPVPVISAPLGYRRNWMDPIPLETLLA